MSDPRSDPGYGDTFRLKAWLRACSAWRWWMATVVLAVCTAAFLVVFTATPYHRATQRLLIERHEDRVLPVGAVQERATAIDDYYLTQYKLLESREIAARALQRLPAADQELLRAEHRDPVAGLMSLIRVQPVRKSRLVDLQAEHPQPEAAGRLARAVVEAYLGADTERRSRARETALGHLRRDARQLQESLNAAERRSQAYKERHGIVSLSEHRNLAQARLEALSAELAAIERDHSDARTRLQTAEQALAADIDLAELPRVLSNQVVTEYKIRLLECNAELTRLERKYKPRHPRLAELRAKQQTMEMQLRREVEAIFGGLQHDAARLQRHREDVGRRIAAATTELKRLEQARVAHRRLQSEVDQLQKVYDTVAQRLHEVEIAATHRNTNVHLVGSPALSRHPVRPRRLATLALALLFSLLLAFGLALLLDGMDESLRTSAEATATTGLPVLARLPQLRGDLDDGRAAEYLALDETSCGAEVFRGLRTRLGRMHRGRAPQTLLVTSAVPGEGKSLSALNLAAAYARAGNRVLLVDADMRCPRQAELLGIEGLEGLSSLLVGERELDEVTLVTGIDNLYLLPSGVRPQNPGELLEIGMGPPLWRQLREEYDLVIFDAPPVGVCSDACHLAQDVDGLLFVVRAAHTHRDEIALALETLRQIGAPPLGLLLNNRDNRAERQRRFEPVFDQSYASPPRPLAAPADGATELEEPVTAPAPDQEVILSDLDPESCAAQHQDSDRSEALEDLWGAAPEVRWEEREPR